MQFNLAQYSKQLSVAFLLALWLAMDLLKVEDQNLRYAIMSLIASITGWHVLNNLPGSKSGAAAVPAAPTQSVPPAQ